MSTDGDSGPDDEGRLRIVDQVHALNNALTTILGLADWHLATADLPEPLRGDLLRIVDAARNAGAATDRLRRLAGPQGREAGQAPAAVPSPGGVRRGNGSAA